MDGTIIGIDYPSPRRAAILKAHESIYEAIRPGTRAEAGANTSTNTSSMPNANSPRCLTKSSWDLP